jgi:alpha-mannosidase
LSRADLPERPGNAGWPAPTPGAQCHGPFGASFALALHGPHSAAVIDAIERTADDVLLPLTGKTLRSALRVPPATAGVELEGSGLAFGAVRLAEADGWIAVRCVNLLDEPVRGRWRFGFDVTEAWQARLDETPEVRLDTGVSSSRAVEFVATPRQVVTILVR